MGEIGKIMNNLHKAGWNISFKRCYVLTMVFALTMIGLTWPLGIIHRILYRSIVDVKNNKQ